MSASDPMRTWWDALERGGYGPHGQAHDFRARCPLHNGDNPEALHIFVGGDGRAVPYCHRCQGHPKEIAEAAGIDPRDSFPACHHRARVYQLADARRRDFDGGARQFVNALAAVLELGGELYGQLRLDCPRCGSPAAVLTLTPSGGVHYTCPGDEYATELGYGACTLRHFQQALAGALHDRRKAA